MTLRKDGVTAGKDRHTCRSDPEVRGGERKTPITPVRIRPAAPPPHFCWVGRLLWYKPRGRKMRLAQCMSATV